MATNSLSLWHGITAAGLLWMACGSLQAADRPPADKPKLVCVSERSTGSHIRKRTCMTDAQVEERRKRDQEALARMKDPVKPLPQGGR